MSNELIPLEQIQSRILVLRGHRVLLDRDLAVFYGVVIVDPITGSMWNITPDKIDQPLSSSQAALIREHKGFVVVLVSQITDSERKQMVRIN